MHIGMIGAGMVALAVAREALAKGHQVVLSSRSGPAALAGKVAELGPGTLAVVKRVQGGDPEWCMNILARAATAHSLDELDLE